MTEEKEPIICVAAPTYGPIAHAAYVNHAACMGKWSRQYKCFFGSTANMTFETAANTLVDLARKGNATHILFCEHDHIFPLDMLPKLLAHKLPVVSGWYTLRRPPFEPVPLCKYSDGQYYKINPGLSPEPLVKVDIACFGCCLIDMSIFEAWPKDKPIFKLRFDETQNYTKTHDVVFFLECTEKNIPIYVDGTVKVGHIGDPLVVTPDNFDVIQSFDNVLAKLKGSSLPLKPAHSKELKTYGSNMCTGSQPEHCSSQNPV